jgi:hypothetical protein
MKRKTYTILVLGALAFCSIANATILNYGYSNLDDNFTSCTWSYHPNKGELGVDLLGAQRQSASVAGSITTDTVLDPIVWRGYGIQNDSTFAWGDYHVVISVAQNYSISLAAVTSPGDWTVITTAPTLIAGQYVGRVDFYAGTAVAIGEELDFNYKLNISGSTQYTIDETLSPSQVPEPGTLALAGLGGLLFAGLTLRKRSR